ncbi:MAG: LacI family DNA-binding transcriptional regulator [Pseudomonadota bacterium]
MVRRSAPSPSIHDVAAAAGVSVMSVSRALRGIEGVSAETRARIVQLAGEMGYMPNSNARALAVTDTKLIGISLPTLFNDVFADILAGLRRSFDQAGYSSVIDTTDYETERELNWAERTLAWQPAALILTGTDHDPRLRDRIARRPVAVLQVWDVTETPLDLCVGIDHFAAGITLGRHGVEMGYRRPAYIGAPEGRDPRADRRFQGIATAFSAAGAAEIRRIAVDGLNSFVAGAEGVRQIDPRAPPDVIFFLTDNMAFGGLMAAETAGLDVPGDMGIIGFNGLDLMSVLPRPITTLHTPRRQIGLTGAQRLLARLNGVTVPKVTTLDCRLIPGGTTAPR